MEMYQPQDTETNDKTSLISEETNNTPKDQPLDHITYNIKNIRHQQVKQFNLQELPSVTSIEFPMVFNKKYSDEENIKKLIFKCGGNDAVSKYIDDLEEEQKVQEFQLEKKMMIMKRIQEKKLAKKMNKKKHAENADIPDVDMDNSENDSNDEKESDEDEDEEEDEDDEIDVGDSEEEDDDDDDNSTKKKTNKRKKRKRKDVITKLHMQPAIGDDALMMYLHKTADSENTFFNEKPILGRPTRDQKIVLKIKIRKNSVLKENSNLSLVEKLQLKGISYETEPVAIIDSSIKFRVTSDAQFTLEHNQIAQDYKNSILDLNFQKMDEFISSIPEMDPKPWFPINENENSYELLPPVKTFISEMPFSYDFKPNKLAEKIATSKSLYVPTYQVQVSGFNEPIPQGPSKILKEKWELAKQHGKYPHFLSVSTAVDFYNDLKDMINLLNEQFEKKPIWVKKHLQGVVEDKISMCGSVLKYALPFVAYRIMKGPWIHSYCKYGVDPKSDNKYAKYQVEQFRIGQPVPMDKFKDYVPCPPNYKSNNEGDIDSRFFLTGKTIPWYSTYTIEVLMKEPHVKDLIENSKYLEVCDAETGWFNELDTWKRKRIIKYILDCLYQGITEFSEDKIKIYKNMPSTKMYTPDSRFFAKSKDLMATNNGKYISKDDDDNDIEENDDPDLYNVIASYNDEEEEDDDDDFDQKLVGNINLEEANFEDIIKRLDLQSNELANEVKESFYSFIKL
mgnify:CR=1 FL=1